MIWFQLPLVLLVTLLLYTAHALYFYHTVLYSLEPSQIISWSHFYLLRIYQTTKRHITEECISNFLQYATNGADVSVEAFTNIAQYRTERPNFNEMSKCTYQTTVCYTAPGITPTAHPGGRAQVTTEATQGIPMTDTPRLAASERSNPRPQPWWHNLTRGLGQ